MRLRRTRSLWVPCSLALCLTATVAHASSPAGVWVKVGKVAFEPNTTAPTRIRIYGAAILYKGPSNVSYLDAYTSPALGYLYYECPSGQAATCVSEWQDVQANIAAPPETCVGLGDQSIPTGRLRPDAEVVAGPDAYPIAMGVLQGYTPCQALADYLKGLPDGGSGAGGTSNSGGASNAGGASGSGGAMVANGGASAGGAGAGGRTNPAGSPGQSTGGRSGSGGANAGGGDGAGGKQGAGGVSSAAGGHVAASSGGAREAGTSVEKLAKPPAAAADKGCNVTSRSTSGASAWALFGAVIGWWRRRRRTR